MISQFKDENRFLSNFVPVEVEFEGLTFPSVEHAYVAAKTTDKNLRWKISFIPSAGKVKRFGREIKIRDDWDSVRVQVMTNLLRQKFNQEPYRTKLLETGEVELKEGNTWHDNFWGSCSCGSCQNRGKNLLGKLLMMIRLEIKQGNLFSGTGSKDNS